jgi:hypothetical protein
MLIQASLWLPVGYERTRAFYIAGGFRPPEEFPNLWGPENPALQMVKVLSVQQ